MALEFPETRLVSKISHPQRPVGQFLDKAKPPRIEFSHEECEKIDDPTLEFAVYHEIGHWFRITLLSKEDAERFSSLGNDESEEECFADRFAMFFLNEGGMAEEVPRQWALMKKLVSNHEVLIRDFASNVFEKLKRALYEG